MCAFISDVRIGNVSKVAKFARSNFENFPALKTQLLLKYALELTTHVKQLTPLPKVETEHKKIKKELKARDEEREKMTKDLQAIDDKLKKAEAKRHEDEARYQREKKEAEEKIRALEVRGEPRGGNFMRDIAGQLAIQMALPYVGPLLGRLGPGLAKFIEMGGRANMF